MPCGQDIPRAWAAGNPAKFPDHPRSAGSYRRFMNRSLLQFCILLHLVPAVPIMAGPAFRMVAGGFDKPLWVGAPKGAKKHLAVAEQTGKIWLVDRATGKRLEPAFLDLATSALRKNNEQGLLGVAFPPDFFESGRFYVNYTDSKGDTRICRFKTMADNRLLADRESEEQLLFVDQPFGNHNGGWLEIGPDGMLYIGLGDGGAADDPHGNGQNLNTHLGKILRIDVSPPKGYKVPADNPFVGKPGAKPEIWLWGLRNPWRCSFDRATGDLWIGDVGQNKIEEVNFVPAKQGAGWNFGWRPREGSIATPSGNVGGAKPAGAVDPIFEYKHDSGPEGGFSVTGGHVYRGPITSIQGRYIVADYQLQRLWSFKQVAGKKVDQQNWSHLLTGPGIKMISSFGEDAEGNLYLADHGNGNIWVLEEKP